LVSTVNESAPRDKFMPSGPSRHQLDFRDQPSDFLESSGSIIGQEQVPHQTGSLGQRLFRNQRARAFPGFEGRFGFRAEHVGCGFARSTYPVNEGSSPRSAVATA
jgi:hypothetical protein